MGASSYQPPDQLTSQPVYVSPRLLFGGLGAAVLILLALALWKSAGRGAGEAPPANLRLQAGQNVRMNLSAAEWATLSIPSEIPSGTLLKSAGDNRNVLALADGSSIRLDRNTSLKIVSIENSGPGQKVLLRLYQGRLFVNEAQHSDVTVETKFVTAVPIGTRFAVSQLEKKDLTESTVVQVVEGSVRMTHLDDKTVTVIVKAGERATAAMGSLESPRGDTRDEWVAWNSGWTDLEKMPVNQGVPTAGTAGTAAPTAPRAAQPAPEPPPAMSAPLPQVAPPPAPPPPPNPPTPPQDPDWVEPNSPHMYIPEPRPQPRTRQARPRVERPRPAQKLPTVEEPKASPPPLIRPDRPLPPRIPIEDATGGGRREGERSHSADPSSMPGEPGMTGSSSDSSGGTGPGRRSPLDAIERRGELPRLEERAHPDF